MRSARVAPPGRNLPALQPTPDGRLGVLMVCMGNICRSPSAEAVLTQRLAGCPWAERVWVDSAGTHEHHSGSPPDLRAQAHAARRGYDLSTLRARTLQVADFERFAAVLVMDAANERAARALCPPALRHKLHRLTDFCLQQRATEVPDPYYGGDAGFERVLDLLEDACAGLLLALQNAGEQPMAQAASDLGRG